ncbi:MAG: exodeoxyribonuclease VII large subunit, partial [Gammaproteobacteria bacterium]
IDWLSKRLKHPGQRLQEYQTQLQQLEKLLVQALKHQLLKLTQTLANNRAKLLRCSPQTLIRAQQHHLKILSQRLQQTIQRQLHQQSNKLNVTSARLDGMSPLKTLGRGYSILFQADGHVLDSINQVTINQNITARLADGTLACTVISKNH